MNSKQFNSDTQLKTENNSSLTGARNEHRGGIKTRAESGTLFIL